MHKRRRVAAFLGPAPADFALLADPAFILHPDFDVLRLGVVALDLCQNLRELRFERRLSDRVCQGSSHAALCARFQDLYQYPTCPSPNPPCDEPCIRDSHYPGPPAPPKSSVSAQRFARGSVWEDAPGSSGLSTRQSHRHCNAAPPGPKSADPNQPAKPLRSALVRPG